MYKVKQGKQGARVHDLRTGSTIHLATASQEELKMLHEKGHPYVRYVKARKAKSSHV